jgi:hypothetical protein|tara:strand:- start:342 stop:545 length:204 start_codon:yes stop_codon:yes gene_type:complete
MSFNRDKEKNHRRALRAFAESEAMSDSDDEDGLDIIESSRKGLDLSQYIDGQLAISSQRTLLALTTL